jgi:D-alanyl-D-alanine carboxypeptidase/D-alanyl-D-alanine-endopeptidase (penicillin-binding protein 4)
VLSLRRVPELLAAAVGTSKLGAALDATFSDPHLGAAAANSCLMVQVGPTPIYSRNPAKAVVPASNLKLLTMTATLDKLSPTSHLTTEVSSAAAPVHGAVAGDLYLVGGGDPLLRTPQYIASLHYPTQAYDNLNALADRVRAAGVTTIAGSVVGDESRYDTQRYIPTWPSRYVTNAEIGPLTAMSVDDGFAGPAPGAPAAQPARQAAATFTALLQARGITVAGPPGSGKAPAGAVTITDLPSAPLSEVAGEILRRSDNNGAELLTKELGRQANPATPTTAAGVAAIQAALSADGLPLDGLHMVDGSGLDRGDRVTCQLVLAALLRSGPSGAIGQGLAIAGKTGTLFQRFVGTPAAGRLRAKTGSLEGASALSGFVLPLANAVAAASAPGTSTATASTTTGNGMAFSLILNGVPSLATGDALCDRIGLLLAQFPQAPPLATLAPLPS